MPGYRLIELSNIRPRKAKGIAPAENVVGILDFLRELGEEPFPLPRMSKWQVVGLEEVLFAARPREGEVAAEIRQRLNRACDALEKRLLEVQMVFDGRLVRGADLTVEYRGAVLPVHLIFNHPPRQEDASGSPYYPMEFHLSSP